jgi:alkanesulfonate monooxygenase SsuD/methylene tetrahydromethanopterin reductase-like flavin-dependent oxidoreductase (luciferase family)
MQYGFVVPGGSLEAIVAAGIEAEAAGWDGYFYYDYTGPDAHDPWVTLAAVALRTERIRLGAVLTPLPWRRPWLVARALTTLDQLSKGRMILPVGLGAVEPEDWARGTLPHGEPVDRKVRADLMDEGLAIIDGMWRGEAVKLAGEHYRVDIPPMGNTPVQRPRIPIWVVGAWGRPKSMRRVLRYDGWLRSGTSEEDWPVVKDYLAQHGPSDRPFEVIVEGETPGEDQARAREIVGREAESGATWWLETRWISQNSPEEVLARIKHGPPRL